MRPSGKCSTACPIRYCVRIELESRLLEFHKFLLNGVAADRQQRKVNAG
jgi:hypothetical protein